MKADDGDFSDPASRAPWARRTASVAPGSAPGTTGEPEPAASAGRRGRGLIASLLGLVLVVVLLATIGNATFNDWNTAPEVPYQAGIESLSIGRILVLAGGLFACILVLFGTLRYALPAVPTGDTGGALRVLFVGVLAASVWLEASGELRHAVIKVFGKVPSGPTRLQTFDAAKAEWNRKFPNYQGAPQLPAFFEGAWRRRGELYLSDVRHVDLRRSDGGLRARIWHECTVGGTPCDAGEVPMQLHMGADGRIESVEAEVDILAGRIWLRMAAGRYDWQPAVLVTQVYFPIRPEWQVSSGREVALRREKPAAALAQFVGDWSRAAPGMVGDFTRLAVRQSGARTLAIRAWARCTLDLECDLGERAAHLDIDGAGGVREAYVTFQRENVRLRLALEPPFQGSFEAASELSWFGPMEGRITRRGGGTSQSTATKSASAVLVRGHAVVATPPAALPAPQSAAPAATAPATPLQAASDCSQAQALHEMAALGCDAMLGALTRAALPDLEQRNQRGLTALAMAVLNGRHEAARLLLTLGADANAAVRFAPAARPSASGLERAQRPQLAEGSTPLILAGDHVMAALLLRFGADHRIRNSYGWSALFYYTHHGSVEMIDTLLAAGADINDTANVDPSHAGSTPLMWAAYMNRTAHLQALLKHKPRLDLRDGSGKTALDYARGFGHREAIRLLEGANSARL